MFLKFLINKILFIFALNLELKIIESFSGLSPTPITLHLVYVTNGIIPLKPVE